MDGHTAVPRRDLTRRMKRAIAALQRDVGNGDLWFALARAFRQTGMRDGACVAVREQLCDEKRCYENAIKHRTSHAGAYLELAECYYQAKEWLSAAVCYREFFTSLLHDDDRYAQDLCRYGVCIESAGTACWRGWPSPGECLLKAAALKYNREQSRRQEDQVFDYTPKKPKISSRHDVAVGGWNYECVI